MASPQTLRVVIVGAGIVGLSEARHFAAQPHVSTVTLIDSNGFEYSRRRGLLHEELAPTVKAADIITSVPPQGSEALHSQRDLFLLGMNQHGCFRAMFPQVYAPVETHKAYARQRNAKPLGKHERARNAPGWVNKEYLRTWEELNPTQEHLLVDTELYCRQHVGILHNSGKVTFIHGTVVNFAFADGGGFTKKGSRSPLDASFTPTPQPSRIKLVSYEVANSMAASDSAGEPMVGDTAVVEADVVVLALGLGAFRNPHLSALMSEGLGVPNGKFRIEGAPMAFFGYQLLQKPPTQSRKLVSLFLFEQNAEAMEFYVRDDGMLYVHWELVSLKRYEDVSKDELLAMAKAAILDVLNTVVHRYFPASIVGSSPDPTRIVFGGVCEYPSVLVRSSDKKGLVEYDGVLSRVLGFYLDGIFLNVGFAHRGIQLGPAAGVVGFYQTECARLGIPPPEAELIARALLNNEDVVEFALHRAKAASKNKSAQHDALTRALTQERRRAAKEMLEESESKGDKEFSYAIDRIDPTRHVQRYVYESAVDKCAAEMPPVENYSDDEEETPRNARLKRRRSAMDETQHDESSGVVEESEERQRASKRNKMKEPTSSNKSEVRPPMKRKSSENRSSGEKLPRKIAAKDLHQPLILILPHLQTCESTEGDDEADEEGEKMDEKNEKSDQWRKTPASAKAMPRKTCQAAADVSKSQKKTQTLIDPIELELNDLVTPFPSDDVSVQPSQKRPLVVSEDERTVKTARTETRNSPSHEGAMEPPCPALQEQGSACTDQMFQIDFSEKY